MRIVLDAIDREDLEVSLKHSNSTTISELIIKRISNVILNHDIVDVSYYHADTNEIVIEI